MTVIDLVARLKANDYRIDAISRIVGYVVLIQALGWDDLQLSRTARHNLQKTFKTLGLDPQDVRL